jgi:hypothetical protein
VAGLEAELRLVDRALDAPDSSDGELLQAQYSAGGQGQQHIEIATGQLDQLSHIADFFEWDLLSFSAAFASHRMTVKLPMDHNPQRGNLVNGPNALVHPP